MQSLVDYLELAAYYGFRMQPACFDSADSRTSGRTLQDLRSS